jgi:4-hydroxyphenylpyruvate dioxygenase-like putative hemolysin
MLFLSIDTYTVINNLNETLMDTEELSKRYMEKYNELATKFEELEISNLVDKLNNAISRSDMAKTNEFYDKVLEWNARVEQLSGAKIALDIQFSYLRLPSPALFGVTFDGEEKIWKFNT